MNTKTDSRTCLAKKDLARLVELLQEDGYTVAAPVMIDGVLLLREIEAGAELARGIRDTQTPGVYRADESGSTRYFDNVVGPDSAKRFFFPATSELFSARVDKLGFMLDRIADEPPKWAIVGVRPCDLAAIEAQDRVFGGPTSDEDIFRCESETYYMRARQSAFLVAVNCTEPGGNCFCDSWGTGPEARSGFDLSLTELNSSFVLRAGSDLGQTFLDRLPILRARSSEIELAELKIARAREHMGKRLETPGLRSLLATNVDHRMWEHMGQSCLGCGNCTMVCPTCFCSTVTDSNDLATGAATRTRRWESCFTQEFSHVTSGAVRSSVTARYRHWLTHKLSAWWDQFGDSGCVGCGRCMTWCPVGIDWTREIEQLQREEGARPGQQIADLQEVSP